MKEVRIIFTKELEKDYKRLNTIVSQEIRKGKISSFHQTLIKAIHKNKELLALNPFYGDQINKKLIPKEYTKKYNIDNLWRIELPGYWRMLYTIRGDEVKIICFILAFMNHKKYNKIFGYKKK